MKRMFLYIAFASAALLAAGSFGGITLLGADPAGDQGVPIMRGFLGVKVKLLHPEVAEWAGMEYQSGLLITEILDDSPAAHAGLKKGDVILALNGNTMKSPAGLAFSVAQLLAGQTAELTIWREGKSQTLRVTIGQHPIWLKDLGLGVADLTSGLAKTWDVPNGLQGALIVNVEPGGPAAKAGVGAGDLIQQVDGKSVASAKAAEEAVEAGSLKKGILLQTRSEDEGVLFVMIRASKP